MKYKLINKLFKILHVCSFDKIIASQYFTFNWRMVVVECECGKREIQKQHHDNVYPFPTTLLITNQEMENLCKNTN